MSGGEACGFSLEPYLSDAACRALACKVQRLEWQQETLRMYGRHIPVPRLTCWLGERGVTYRYAGADHVATPWPDWLRQLAEDVAARFNLRFNFVLLNRYRNGADYMGWHKDDERGTTPWIASLSLGASRPFDLQLPTGRQRVQLEAGSVLCFDGRLRHRLPKAMRVEQERINLTFRHIVVD